MRKLDDCLSGGHDAVNRLLVKSCALEELLSVNLERLLWDGRAKAATGLSRTEIWTAANAM